MTGYTEDGKCRHCLQHLRRRSPQHPWENDAGMVDCNMKRMTIWDRAVPGHGPMPTGLAGAAAPIGGRS